MKPGKPSLFVGWITLGFSCAEEA